MCITKEMGQKTTIRLFFLRGVASDEPAPIETRPAKNRAREHPKKDVNVPPKRGNWGSKATLHPIHLAFAQVAAQVHHRITRKPTKHFYPDIQLHTKKTKGPMVLEKIERRLLRNNRASGSPLIQAYSGNLNSRCIWQFWL